MPAPVDHSDWPRLIQTVFHSLFLQAYETELVNAGEEPLYVPKSAHYRRHRIYFARGFWSSALHEIAHWCLAGSQRRQLRDYGYWYVGEGRDASRQLAFEQVEVRPQALEWLFTSVLSADFFCSFDNFGVQTESARRFRQAVREQALAYLAEGLPRRAQMFLSRLLQVRVAHQEFQLYWSDIRNSGTLPG